MLVQTVGTVQQRLLAAVEAAGVPGQWYAVLHLLLRADGHRLPMSRLAREVSFTSGGFSKLADRMGREGLIDRRGSSGDRRIVFATLTPKGVEVAESAERAYTAAFEEFVLNSMDATRVRDVAAAVEALQPAAVPMEPDEAESEDLAADPVPRDREFLDRRGANRAGEPSAG